MGELIEHIMAAQAEFYSANLSFEVKKGLQERLRRGLWSGSTPIGYLNRNGKLILDQTKSPLLRYAFERWASGKVNSRELAEEMYEKGLLGRTGKKIQLSGWCRILHSHFYIGKMLVNDNLSQGIHPALISTELFQRCQDVFKARNSGGRTRKKLNCLLAKKIICPQCGLLLVGEEHPKRSKVYRYYRCHERSCRFRIKAEPVEDTVTEQLKAANVDMAAFTKGDPVQKRMVIEHWVKFVSLKPEPVVEFMPEKERRQVEEDEGSNSYLADTDLAI